MKQNQCPDMCTPGDRACIPQETVIENVQLANAYVPWQKLCATFTPMRSLIDGTAFPELLDVYSGETRYGY